MTDKQYEPATWDFYAFLAIMFGIAFAPIGVAIYEVLK